MRSSISRAEQKSSWNVATKLVLQSHTAHRTRMCSTHDFVESCLCEHLLLTLRKARSLQKHVEEIIVKHDELADFKSSYDCSEKIDSAMPDSKKPAK